MVIRLVNAVKNYKSSPWISNAARGFSSFERGGGEKKKTRTTTKKEQQKTNGSETRANCGLIRCRGKGQASTGQVEGHAGQSDFTDEATKGFDSDRSHEYSAEGIDLCHDGIYVSDCRSQLGQGTCDVCW